MTIRVIYPPDPYTIFEPRPVRTHSIAELLPIVPIPEKGTEEPYHESWWYWTNPDNTITHTDIVALRHYLYGEEFEYPIASEDVQEHWQTCFRSKGSQDTGYESPSVCGGNKR